MPTDLQQIDTIIIVMLENRSFDHVLGYLSRAGSRTDVNGLKDDAWIAAQANAGRVGTYAPYALEDVDIPDPPHERDPIDMQIRPTPGSNVKMRGFVQSYARRVPPPDDESLVMGFYEAPQVPMADFFAREFLICDRWFSSLPTGTQPNRLMAMSGTTALDVNAPFLLPNQDLVYDWLTNHGVSWRVYYDGLLPFFSLMPKWQGPIANGLLVDQLGIDTTFRRFDKFDRDFTYDPTLPSVIFIEPEYTDGPHWEANDDHPPTSIAAGQAFLYSIYRALLRRPDRWAKTVMIVTYDEHGGFFDHEPPLPLKTTAPPGFSYPDFETTGVRVPAFVVSPFVERGAVFSEPLDHTSMLAFLAERFTPGEPYSEAVARRSAPLSRLASALTRADPRSDIPPAPPEARVVPPSVPMFATDTSVRAEGAANNALAFRAAVDSTMAEHPATAIDLLPRLGHSIESA
jgi:phospholipase C